MLTLCFKGFRTWSLSFQNNFKFAYKNLWILSHQQYQWFIESLKLLSVTLSKCKKELQPTPNTLHTWTPNSFQKGAAPNNKYGSFNFVLLCSCVESSRYQGICFWPKHKGFWCMWRHFFLDRHGAPRIPGLL